MAAEHTASRYQNDKLMQYQIGKKGPETEICFVLEYVFWLFSNPFVTTSGACSPKALHDQQY
jgi:hypothetical protein